MFASRKFELCRERTALRTNELYMPYDLPLVILPYKEILRSFGYPIWWEWTCGAEHPMRCDHLPSDISEWLSRFPAFTDAGSEILYKVG